jgi:hypothetical protein
MSIALLIGLCGDSWRSIAAINAVLKILMQHPGMWKQSRKKSGLCLNLYRPKFMRLESKIYMHGISVTYKRKMSCGANILLLDIFLCALSATYNLELKVVLAL